MASVHHKKVFILGSLVLGIAIIVTAQPQKKEEKEHGKEHVHHNLKVLPKNISHDSLDAIMDYFKASLGVKCNFCHAASTTRPGKLDFASDEKKEKTTARYMIRMTAQINAKYFNPEHSKMPDTIRVVKCMTCHHGHSDPLEFETMNKPDKPDHD